MALFKKDYDAIAGIINDAVEAAGDDHSTYSIIEDLAVNLSDYFDTDNPRFDSVKFFEAAGVLREETSGEG